MSSRVGEKKKGMLTYSTILAWRILLSEKPRRLQFMGLQRVRHNRATNTTPECMPLLQASLLQTELLKERFNSIPKIHDQVFISDQFSVFKKEMESKRTKEPTYINLKLGCK